MKKFLKIFIPIVIILGGIALAICYMVIPERTKAAADVVVGYMNTPLFIAGGTTITVGLVVGVVIKFIYDRYKDNVKKELNNIKLDFEAKKKEIEDKYNEQKIKSEEYLEKLALENKKLWEMYITLEDAHNISIEAVYDLFKLIPNKKVQEKVEELYGREERINNQAEEK